MLSKATIFREMKSESGFSFVMASQPFGKYNAGRAIFGGYISWAADCCHGKWRRKINTNGWDGSSIDVTSLGQAPDSGVACPGIVPRSEGAALGYEHNLTKSSMWAIILTNPLYSNIVWMASSMWCSVGATFRLGSHLSQYIHLSNKCVELELGWSWFEKSVA